MRHVFVTQDYGPELGGMARRHAELCRRWAGMAVSTVACDGSSTFDGGERYPIHRQPFPRARANRFANQLHWARWLVGDCRRVRPGVLHCGNLRPAGHPVLWAHRRLGIPYVLYVNGFDLLREREKAAANAMKRRISRALFTRARGVIANSAWTAEVAREVMRDLGVPAAGGPAVASIELGTDPAFFTPARDTGAFRRRLALDGDLVLLTVARLVPHKGQDVAMQALARLLPEFPRLRYVMVGEGHDEARYRALARELGVADRVVFAGPLGDDDVAEAYATADLYVGLSRVSRGTVAEGFGISFVEAGASGTPSVAGDSGGVRSAVRDGETGLVVPPADVDAVAAALRALLVDPVRRAGMGAAARRLAVGHHNWDRVAAETRAFVADVAGGAG